MFAVSREGDASSLGKVKHAENGKKVARIMTKPVDILAPCDLFVDILAPCDLSDMIP